MKTIWKYTIATLDEQVVNMPQGAKILTVQMQNGEPQLWAACDAAEPVEPRRISIRGTGHSIDDVTAGHYVGTYQLAGGALVFHVFARPSAGGAS